MDYRGNSVAKFSGGFADPLLKFRWIIRRGGGGGEGGLGKGGPTCEKTWEVGKSWLGGRLRTYYT